MDIKLLGLRSQIDSLIQRLISLQASIQAIRDEIRPLEVEMDAAQVEYRAAIQPLFLTLNRLQSRLDTAGMRLPNDAENMSLEHEDQVSKPETGKKRSEGTSRGDDRHRTSFDDRDRMKDELLQFVAWVLVDPTPEIQQLQMKLSDMYNNSVDELADMLEIIPPALFEEQLSEDSMNPDDWYARLGRWEKALINRLEELEAKAIYQRHSSQFALVQLRRQGSGAWQRYLAQEQAKFRESIVLVEQLLAQKMESHS